MVEDDVKEQLARRLVLAHGSYYDMVENYEFAGQTFRGYGEFHSYGEQYVLSKKAKLWEINNHDHLFIHVVDVLDDNEVSALIEFLTTKGLEKCGPKPSQMSCDLSLVIVASKVTEQAAEKLRRTRFRKNFKFGLEGWTDLRLAAIDLAGSRVITNRAGKAMRKTLEANARFGDELVR